MKRPGGARDAAAVASAVFGVVAGPGDDLGDLAGREPVEAQVNLAARLDGRLLAGTLQLGPSRRLDFVPVRG